MSNIKKSILSKKQDKGLELSDLVADLCAFRVEENIGFMEFICQREGGRWDDCSFECSQTL